MKSKYLVFFLTIGFASFSFAISRIDFLGVQTQISITSSNSAGQSDQDAYSIFSRMNVPVKNTFLGPGKAIVSNSKDLNLVCANRNNSGYQCAIFIKTSGRASIDPVNKRLVYKMDGAEAKEMLAKWNLKDREVHFISVDGFFKIDLDENSFKLEYSQSGFAFESDNSEISR